MSLCKLTIGILIGLYALSAVRADTLVLNDGTLVQGKIRLRSPQEVRIETESGMRVIPMSKIAEIREDANAESGDKGDEKVAEGEARLTPSPHAACRDCDQKGVLQCSSCGGRWKSAKLRVTCDKCGGTGTANCRQCHGTDRIMCKVCNGKGTVRRITGYVTGNGMRRPTYGETRCSNCGASGKLRCPVKHRNSALEINCETCEGAGTCERRGVCPECIEGFVYCKSCENLTRRDREARELRERLEREARELKERQEREARELRARLVRENRETREFFRAANLAAKERVGFVAGETKTLTAHEVPERLRLWLEVNRGSKAMEVEMIARHEKQLATWFRELPTMLARDVCFHSPTIPVELCQDESGKVLLIKGVVPQVSIRGKYQTTDQRAREVARAIATPFFYSLDQVLDGSTFDAFAVVVFYGKENFIDMAEAQIQPEAFAIIANAEKARLLVRGKITEQEFYRDAQFFCADRDRGLGMGLIRTEFRP